MKDFIELLQNLGAKDIEGWIFLSLNLPWAENESVFHLTVKSAD